MSNDVAQLDPSLMWIYGIFSALQVRYGRRFLAQYDGVGINLVHRDWARVLRDFERNPAAVKWAACPAGYWSVSSPTFGIGV